jgi:hypothetical protein
MTDPQVCRRAVDADDLDGTAVELAADFNHPEFGRVSRAAGKYNRAQI